MRIGPVHRVAAAGVVLAIALTGCNAKTTPEQKRAIGVVVDFTKALAADQDISACELMTPAGQKALVASIGLGTVSTCIQAVHQASVDLGSGVRKAFRSGVQTEAIKVTGARATVLLEDLTPVRLVKAGGVWRISSFESV